MRKRERLRKTEFESEAGAWRAQINQEESQASSWSRGRMVSETEKKPVTLRLVTALLGLSLVVADVGLEFAYTLGHLLRQWRGNLGKLQIDKESF